MSISLSASLNTLHCSAVTIWERRERFIDRVEECVKIFEGNGMLDSKGELSDAGLRFIRTVWSKDSFILYIDILAKAFCRRT